MKKIKLTQGKFAIVDDEDFDYLNQWKWHLSTGGYAVRKSKETTRMHRLINNTPKDLFTDHINRNKLDNRKENLRTVTKSQNGINRPKQSNNKSGYKGICWNNHAKKWMVEIQVKSNKIYLGIYTSIKDAILVRQRAERIYHEKI